MKKTILILMALSLYLFPSNPYEKGLKLLKENNSIKAKIEFIQASEMGNAKAMYKLGLIYQKEQNLSEALHWYQKAKLAGNVKAKYNLGVLSCKMKTYQYLKDFEEYAQNSSKNVQYDLAVCFSKKGNISKAKQWFKIVANKGNAKAQYHMASLVKSKKTKIRWLKKSAKNNFIEAQFELGKTLFKMHQFKKAKYWLRKAQRNGSRKAKIYLKRMKELGL